MTTGPSTEYLWKTVASSQYERYSLKGNSIHTQTQHGSFYCKTNGWQQAWCRQRLVHVQHWFSLHEMFVFLTITALAYFFLHFFSLHTDFELCLLYVKLTVLFCRFLNTCMMKAIDLSLRKILLFSLPLPLPLPSPFGETSFCASSHCSCQHAPSSFMLVTATSTMSLGSWVSVRVSSFLRTVECQKLLETLNDAEFCWLHITVVLLFNRTCQLGWISWKHLWILTFSSYSNLWRMCLACCSRI